MSGDAFTAWQNGLLSLYLQRKDQTKTCLRFSASRIDDTSSDETRGGCEQQMSRLILVCIHSSTKHALQQIGNKNISHSVACQLKKSRQKVYIYMSLAVTLPLTGSRSDSIARSTRRDILWRKAKVWWNRATQMKRTVQANYLHNPLHSSDLQNLQDPQGCVSLLSTFEWFKSSFGINESKQGFLLQWERIRKNRYRMGEKLAWGVLPIGIVIQLWSQVS